MIENENVGQIAEKVINTLEPTCRAALEQGTSYLSMSTLISWCSGLIVTLIFFIIFCVGLYLVITKDDNDNYNILTIVSFVSMFMFGTVTFYNAGNAIATYYYPIGALVNKALEMGVK